jgi:hypothetical protein
MPAVLAAFTIRASHPMLSTSKNNCSFGKRYKGGHIAVPLHSDRPRDDNLEP